MVSCAAASIVRSRRRQCLQVEAAFAAMPRSHACGRVIAPRVIPLDEAFLVEDLQ